MTDWMIDLIEKSGYLGIALLMFLETVFPPIPSELIMPVAGLEAAKGEMKLPGVIAAGTAGAMAGNYLWYMVARQIGTRRLKPLIDRWGRWLTIDWHGVKRAERQFKRHGAAVVFFGRMLPTLRSLISVPAGLLKMPQPGFLIWSTIGTAGWTALLAASGYALGRRYAEIENYVGPLSTAVILVLALGYVWRMLTWKPRT